MIVEEIMRTEVVALSKDDSIAKAIKLMDEKKIRHLPIIDENQYLIGLVTDRDIRDATPSILFETEKFKELLQNPLKMIMKTDIITGHPLDFVEEVSGILYEHRIGCLPILKEDKLVGIVTETDLLRTLVELTGAHQPGSQIEVKVPNKAGMLYEITTVIRNRKANIQSVLVYPDKKDEKYKIIVLRVQMMNPLSIIKDLQDAGHQVLWPNDPGQSS
ncbi:acetoin utilization AcuB family protein [Bacillus sp. DTU_2020_1000418_1_SI_GHA_SEK_038]|uniref:acetoin utilization AcuB family protein n=1 Tax=Bacillus sp. DTU_2020_1000418_1_SI_GHA_SEK_038 TaxID=3077585 RepID=UPI0028EE284B|nr:acetoin utilization AcuB family protein [Bacillus sp. DTU_2020_1000418_1_SI_GHA_SEK_038]WNS74622.1 acetoin utilization AcuB family protein [Bacillus sp. DTU_2020_1000418_1_SI_GHA_SEK_038]